MPGGVMTQTLITTLPGLDEHRCANKEHYRVVPSTEAAVDRITATANDKGEDETPTFDFKCWIKLEIVCHYLTINVKCEGLP